MVDTEPEKEDKEPAIKEIPTSLPLEEPYTDEERQKDIKLGKHLFLCFFYFWIALLYLTSILWGGGSDVDYSSPPAFGLAVETILIVVVYDQGAKAFGKPGIDTWPRPIRFIMQEKVGKAALALFLACLAIWQVISNSAHGID